MPTAPHHSGTLFLALQSPWSCVYPFAFPLCSIIINCQGHVSSLSWNGQYVLEWGRTLWSNLFCGPPGKGRLLKSFSQYFHGSQEFVQCSLLSLAPNTQSFVGSASGRWCIFPWHSSLWCPPCFLMKPLIHVASLLDDPTTCSALPLNWHLIIH